MGREANGATDHEGAEDQRGEGLNDGARIADGHRGRGADALAYDPDPSAPPRGSRYDNLVNAGTLEVKRHEWNEPPAVALVQIEGTSVMAHLAMGQMFAARPTPAAIKHATTMSNMRRAPL